MTPTPANTAKGQATMRTEPAWITRILFATDFSPCAHHAEKQAAFLSKAYGAKVDVVHVLELYPGVYAAVQDHEETDGRLADAVQRLRSPTVSATGRSEEHTSELQSPKDLVCRLLLEKK